MRGSDTEFCIIFLLVFHFCVFGYSLLSVFVSFGSHIALEAKGLRTSGIKLDEFSISSYIKMFNLGIVQLILDVYMRVL